MRNACYLKSLLSTAKKCFLKVGLSVLYLKLGMQFDTQQVDLKASVCFIMKVASYRDCIGGGSCFCFLYQRLIYT